MKTRNSLLLTILIALAINLFGTPPTPPAGYKWQLSEQYSDEFDGTSLDETKWRKKHPFWNGRRPAYFNPDAISVGDGYMKITNGVYSQPFDGYNIYGGAVTSVNENTKFAYYECRLKASSTRMSTTFWLENRKAALPGGCAGDEYSQELDIVETIGESTNPVFYNYMKSNTHFRWKDCNGGNEQFFSKGTQTGPISTQSNEDFHTYGAYWKDATQVQFFLDDQAGENVNFRTDKTSTPFDRGMFICMVTETYDWEATPINSRLTNPALNTSYYDWVRVWVLVPDDTPPTPVSSVSVSPTTSSLEAGETTTLTATVLPAGASNKTVSWSSSNNNIASVSNGTVTAIAAGTATITVTTQDGNKTATCAVTVTPSTGTTVNLSAIQDAYLQGSTRYNTADLRVESGNRVSYLMFDLSGLSGTITNAELKLSVSNDAGNGPINIAKGNSNGWTEANLTTSNAPTSSGQLGTLNATYSVGQSYTWNLDESTISTGGMLSVIITQTSGGDVSFASDEHGTAALKPVLTIRTSTEGPIAVSGVTVTPTSAILSSVGATQALSATVTPTDAENKAITWNSSNTAVASVNSDGIVTAIANGSSTITVTTADGGFTATSTISVDIPPVVIPVSGVSISQTSLSIEEGQTASLTATVAPSNATDKSVNWASSNNSIATINSSGVVTAVAVGTATMTVTTVDQGKTATCNVTVTAIPGGSDFTLGNGSNTNATPDGWKSNLVINETDTYTNSSGSPQTITINQFSFYANKEADPLTPFVVKVNSDNNFTVLAVGTTRTSSAYNVGQNTVAFNDGGASITINNGEKIATGFLDANADGSGGNLGSVIPYDNSGDQIWYTGGAASTNSGSVIVGSVPTSGASTITTLTRNYHYNISFTTGTSSIVNVTGVSVSPTSSTMDIGQTTNLTATVTPANADDKSVTWSSSNSSIASVNSGVVTAVAAGSATITVTTTDGGFTATSSITVNAVAPEQTPYGGTPWAIPGRIESEDYDNGGEGIAYHDLTTTNSGNQGRTAEGVDIETCSEGGLNIGWNSPAEWQEYTVDVTTAGDYEISIRYAASSTAGTVNIAIGSASTGNTSLPVTGGWQTYQTVTKTITLSAGQQIMRVNTVDAGMNYNYIDIQAVSTGPANLLTNFDFETGDLSSWNTWGTVSVVSNNQHGGTYAVTVNGAGAPSQNITVKPNTTYTLSAWGKVAASGQHVFLGVKNHDAVESSTQINTTSYSLGTHTFTTGANATTAQIYFYCPNASYQVWGDDFELIEGTKAAEEYDNSIVPISMTIYPNPATDVINLQISSELESSAKLYLYDNAGAVIINQEIYSQEVSLDVNQLSKGMYMVVLVSGSEVTIERIIKH